MQTYRRLWCKCWGWPRAWSLEAKTGGNQRGVYSLCPVPVVSKNNSQVTGATFALMPQNKEVLVPFQATSVYSRGCMNVWAFPRSPSFLTHIWVSWSPCVRVNGVCCPCAAPAALMTLMRKKLWPIKRWHLWFMSSQAPPWFYQRTNLSLVCVFW